MLKRITTLVRKDFFEFCFSKSWIIVLLMPLFIYFIYTVVYKQAETGNFTIAYTPNPDSALIKIISGTGINLKQFPDPNTAKSALNQGEIDGVILSDGQSSQLSLLVDKARTQEAVFIVNTINFALINAYRSQAIPQINLRFTNEQLPVRWLSFPVWLLQIILTVCLLQAAGAVADEKERQTLHSLLVSPMSFREYLLSKLIWYTVIGVGALFLTVFLTKAPLNLWYVLLFGVSGSLAFGALSLLIGLLAPTALFARTFATLTYLIAALPLMVRDISFAWKESLYLFPSFLVLKGFEKALLTNSYQPEITFWVIGLLVQTFILLSITGTYLQKKADF